MLPFEYSWLLLLLIPVISLLYAAVGHGGASGFLALMAIFNVPALHMKPTALLLNLFVSGISFYLYYKKGHFSWKLFYPFAIGSIPAAFTGGLINANPLIYKKILGVLLIISVLRMLGVFGKEPDEIKAASIYKSIVIGAAIGFFSGLIGIGGGIILSPVILLLHWAKMKETAAVSALFIWINSLAGLSGMFFAGASIPLYSLFFVAFALAGGWLGGYLGSSQFDNLLLKRMLSFVLLIASFKLLFT